MNTDSIPHARLGRSGLMVSRIALGTMNFGDRTDETEAARIFSEAVDAGVNFIDTADAYASGESERIVGKLVQAERSRFVLATKLGNPMGAGSNRGGLSRKWILEEAEASLRRLGTDFVDILYLHKEDLETPLEETVRAIETLLREGKIRYFGVSNFRSWRIAAIAHLCDEAGIDRPVVSQPLYHALNRSAEIEQLPVCGAFGIGVAVYSPNARGVLSGKYQAGQEPPSDSRAGVKNRRILQTEFHPENIKVAQQIVAYAGGRGIDPTAFATAWVLANPLVTCALAGPRTVEQWRTYRGAAGVTWLPEDEAAVDALVAAGKTAIAGYLDPAYPPKGRPIRL